MIQSMTAFARTQEEGLLGSMVCEIRSINHRYLEVSLRLPEGLHELETNIRELIREHIKRGKVELFLRLQTKTDNTPLNLNTALIDQLCAANKVIAEKIKTAAPVNTMDILQWPGVLQMAEMDFTRGHKEVLTLLTNTLEKLITARQREGQQLTELFFQRLASMKTELAKVRERMPQVLKHQRTRLLTRCNEVNLQVDNDRLEQELVIQAQKSDITEEIERLETHIAEVESNLKQGNLIGRKLDFFMQELNREANTLGAKSVDVEVTRAAVELKVLIEQMREQVQNVE